MKPHACINCQNEFEGKFCPECGLKTGIAPHSFGFFANSLLRALDLERGMFVTFKHLFTKPAEVTDQFLSGNTRKYSNPIQYLVVSITITFLFFFNKDNWVLYLRSGLLLAVMWAANYLFSRRHTNFYGHLMIAFYQVGQISFMFLISALIGPLLSRVFGNEVIVTAIKIVLFISYPVWSSVKMFHLKGQQALLFLLFILVNANIGIYLWVQFIVQQKNIASF